jgi:hypothetical protein
MKNIHALPTDKPSRLHLAYDKDYYLSIEPFIQLDTKNYKSFNIYITSDEEIKEGDWCIDVIHNTICKRNSDNYRKQYKKIILTTDKDLISDGVQSIDDEFLEWFVENPSCENVEVERWTDYKLKNNEEVIFFNYKIKYTISKEKPKNK